MKKLLSALSLMLICASAHAGAYFRLIGPGNYGLYDGALFSTKGISQTQNTTLIPVVTHSTKDGSILPQSWQDAGFAEAWTPFAIGGSQGGGNATLNFGPVVNIGPQLQALLLNYVIPQSAVNLRSHLVPVPGTGGFDVSFAFGFVLNAQAVQHGLVMPINRWWDDPVRYYAGPKLRF